MSKSRKTPLKPNAPQPPATGAPSGKTLVPHTNPLRQSDLRWQRSVRFNWDNGGHKGGGHGGRR